MMSTHRAALYPGLNRVLDLEALTSEDDRGFLLTKLRRQVNRFNDKLRTAAAQARDV